MISIVIKGLQFYHTLRSTVTVSLDTLSNALSMEISDRWAQGNLVRQINPFDECQVYIGNNKIIDGYIDRVSPKVTPTSNSITISARDKCADLVDCAAVHKTGEWSGIKLDKIVRELCAPFGVSVKVETDIGEPLPYFRIEQSMTAFEAIQKLCSLRSILAIASNDGNLILTRAGDDFIPEKLIQGVNIIEYSADFDASQRFSEYTVKGQSLSGEEGDTFTGEIAFSGTGTVKDLNVPRYRPTILVESAPVNNGTCQRIAKWELAKARGKSRNFKVKIAGLLRDDGSLWPLNKQIFLDSNYLGVYDKLLISGIQYSSDNTGDFVTFTLAPKDAYIVIPDLTLQKPQTQNSLFGNSYIQV